LARRQPSRSAEVLGPATCPNFGRAALVAASEFISLDRELVSHEKDVLRVELVRNGLRPGAVVRIAEVPSGPTAAAPS
jgi:hypothetical protein